MQAANDTHPARAGLFAGLALGAVLALAPAGCESAKIGQPLTGELAGNSAADQLEFWHQLAERPVVSNDEAWHALLLFLEGQDPAGDYPGRVRRLQERGVLDAGFDAPAEHAVQRGPLAVAIVRLLEIKGGVAMAILGPTPRYALRELVHLQIYQPSSPWQTLTGGEFVGLMGKVEDEQRILARRRQPPVAPAPPVAPVRPHRPQTPDAPGAASGAPAGTARP